MSMTTERCHRERTGDSPHHAFVGGGAKGVPRLGLSLVREFTRRKGDLQTLAIPCIFEPTCVLTVTIGGNRSG